jgi:hypothetical protein
MAFTVDSVDLQERQVRLMSQGLPANTVVAFVKGS